MNKKSVYLLTALILVLGLYFMLKKDNDTTLRKDLVEFKIENVKDINKVRIIKKDVKGAIVLEKKAEGLWILNDKWEANMDNVDLILETIEKIEVKSPLAKNLLNNEMNYLAVSGKKVEFFKNDQLIRTIYLGRTTPNSLGTIGMLEGAKSPYVVHIPSFKGHINTRFMTDEKDWRSRFIYTIPSEEIANIKVTWVNEPKENIEIDNTGSDPILKGGDNTINQNKVRSYLNHFERIPFTVFANNVTDEEALEIEKQEAFCIIELEDKSGAKRVTKLHYKPIERSTFNKFDENNEPLVFEKESYHAFVDDNHECLIVKHATFQKIMKRFSDFKL